MLSTREVAEILGVSPETVRSYVMNGYLNCRQMPGKRGRRLFHKEDVEAFIKRLETQSNENAV